MGRALLVLDTPADKAKATMWIGKAPIGTRVEFKASKRTLPQNDLMWALLTEVAQQLEHAGRKYDASQWKAIFLHAFGREVSFLPSLDQKTFLPIELSSADLSKDEMTDFIEFILKEGGQRGVVFRQSANTHPGAADLPPADRAPASDELSPGSSEQDGGDAPLSSPSTNLVSDGLANPSVDGDGAVSPDSNAPSSSPLSMVDRSLLIECCAKFMDLTVRSDLTPQERRGALEKAKEAWKAELRPELHPKLASMFLSADAIIRGKADRAKAITEFSYWLECEPEEIGGAS